MREATRFKSTRASVNVPSRNEEVIRQAEQQAEYIGMPVTIARATFEAILNSSVPFEQCIVSYPLPVNIIPLELTSESGQFDANPQ